VPTADVARQPDPVTEVAATTEAGPLSRPAAGTGAAEPACPHCRKPVVLVAWLVPPAAATVKEPPRHADTIRDYQ
jgi:hypothetical protein